MTAIFTTTVTAPSITSTSTSSSATATVSTEGIEVEIEYTGKAKSLFKVVNNAVDIVSTGATVTGDLRLVAIDYPHTAYIAAKFYDSEENILGTSSIAEAEFAWPTVLSFDVQFSFDQPSMISKCILTIADAPF
jgi:hypothetical protein